MKVKLRIVAPDKDPQRLTLERELVRIGRARSCDVVIADQKASGHHADLYTLDGEVLVRDLNSTNGVFVNGQRLTEAPLHVGDSVRIGDTLISIDELENESANVLGEHTALDLETIQDRFSFQVPLDDVEDRNAALQETSESKLIRRKLRVLARLGKDLARLDAGEPHGVRLARLVRETVGPERLAIVVPSGEHFQSSLSFDWRFPEPERPVYVPEALLHQAISKKRALLNVDLLADPRYRDDAAIRSAPTHSAMAVPLFVGDELQAAIYVDRAAPNPFTNEDLHTLAVIANQSAVILENARLFDDLRRSEEALVAKNRTLNETLEKLRITQGELIQAAKLSSLGEFAAGITHELNNPLAGILGYAEILEDDGGLPAGALVSVRTIRKAAERMKTIVQKVVSFARRDTGATRASVDMNDAIRASIELLMPDLKMRNVEVRLDLAARAIVLGNLNELEQVIVNIVHNAAQAMTDGPGRAVHISSRLEGETVRVAMRDEGPGIPPAYLARVFDPFFTTKAVGVGTGLGLSVSYGIIASHGGTITASSEIGRGATFEIILPAERSAEPSPTAPTPAKSAVEGRGHSVLVVDDDAAVRGILSRVLERAGYAAEIFGEPVKALAALEKRPFDVVICDLKMPDLQGEDLYRRAIESRPALRGRFLFITGSIGTTHGAFLREFAPFVLHKPFALVEVMRRIAEIASGGAPSDRRGA